MSLFITCNFITLQRQCWSPAWINPWDRRPKRINAKHKKNEPVEVSEQIFYMSKIISLIGSCLSLHHVSGSFQFVMFKSKIRQLLSLPVMKTWMWLSFSCESERLSEECGLRSTKMSEDNGGDVQREAGLLANSIISTQMWQDWRLKTPM